MVRQETRLHAEFRSHNPHTSLKSCRLTRCTCLLLSMPTLVHGLHETSRCSQAQVGSHNSRCAVPTRCLGIADSCDRSHGQVDGGRAAIACLPNRTAKAPTSNTRGTASVSNMLSIMFGIDVSIGGPTRNYVAKCVAAPMVIVVLGETCVGQSSLAPTPVIVGLRWTGLLPSNAVG